MPNADDEFDRDQGRRQSLRESILGASLVVATVVLVLFIGWPRPATEESGVVRDLYDYGNERRAEIRLDSGRWVSAVLPLHLPFKAGARVSVSSPSIHLGQTRLYRVTEYE